MEFACSPLVCGGFHLGFWFPPTSLSEVIGVSNSSRSEGVWVAQVSGLVWKGVLSKWVLTLCPELLERLWSPATRNWDKRVGQ